MDSILRQRGLLFVVLIFSVDLFVSVRASELIARDSCEEILQEPESQQFEFSFGADKLTTIPEDAIINEINVHVFNVFHHQDSTQAAWYEDLANSLNILTKERVILSQLLFSIGDPWSEQLIVESERLLRRKKYFFDAKIRASKLCGNKVTVQVIVREVWTLIPGLGFNRSGGENRTSLSFSDQNFLGSGAFISLGRTEDSERKSSLVSFRDPNLFGSRWTLSTSVVDKDDGDSQTLSVQKPFYSLNSKDSYTLNYYEDKQEDSLYFRNQVIEKFQHRQQTLDIAIGLSQGLIDGTSQRWHMGWHGEEHRFTAIAETSDASQIATDRNRSYLWLGFEQTQNNFSKARQFIRLDQTEDVFLGKKFKSQLGYGSNDDFGRSDFWSFSSEFSDSYVPFENTLSFVNFSANGFWIEQTHDWENLVLNVSSQVLINPFSKSQWLASGSLTYSKNLTNDRQLLLGGDNGLRGYPARYQSGDRRFLFTLEKRNFFDWKFAGMVNFAFATFFDIGRAWYPDTDNGVNGGTLMDLGFGLRISSDRVRIDRVLHVDIAFPLNKEDKDIDSVQFLITAKSRF